MDRRNTAKEQRVAANAANAASNTGFIMGLHLPCSFETARTLPPPTFSHPRPADQDQATSTSTSTSARRPQVPTSDGRWQHRHVQSQHRRHQQQRPRTMGPSPLFMPHNPSYLGTMIPAVSAETAHGACTHNISAAAAPVHRHRPVSQKKKTERSVQWTTYSITENECYQRMLDITACCTVANLSRRDQTMLNDYLEFHVHLVEARTWMSKKWRDDLSHQKQSNYKVARRRLHQRVLKWRTRKDVPKRERALAMELKRSGRLSFEHILQMARIIARSSACASASDLGSEPDSEQETDVEMEEGEIHPSTDDDEGVQDDDRNDDQDDDSISNPADDEPSGEESFTRLVSFSEVLNPGTGLPN